MSKGSPQAKMKSLHYKKKGKRKFHPQRGDTPAYKEKGLARPSPGSPRSPSSKAALPSLSYVPGELKKIGVLFGSMILFLFSLSVFLPREATAQAIGTGALILLFALLLLRKS